jgi:GT2 family glycosyltransferase
MAQKGVRARVVVVDNASTDGTAEILKEFGARIDVIPNRCNVGFAAAQNQGIRSNRAEWVLTLNPDLLMEEDFVRRLVDAGELDDAAGAVCGKLLSIGHGFQRLTERRIDSTGLFFTPTGAGMRSTMVLMTGQNTCLGPVQRQRYTGGR